MRDGDVFLVENFLRLHVDGGQPGTAGGHHARALRDLALECGGRAQRFHQRKPRALGMEVEALHRLLAKDVGPDAFAIVLRSLVDERRVETSVAHPYG